MPDPKPSSPPRSETASRNSTKLHTGDVAAAPEQGKPTFLRRMDEEIARTRAKYPHARNVGISDGAGDYLVLILLHSSHASIPMPPTIQVLPAVRWFLELQAA